MVLTPMKKPCHDVAKGRSQKLYGIKLSRGKTLSLRRYSPAPTGFQTPAALDDRVWRVTKAIGHIILMSRKTSLRQERRQTLSLEH